MDSALIISLIEDVVRERNVHKDDVFYAIEHALLSLARDRYGSGDLSVTVNRETGDISLFQNCTVVENNPTLEQIELSKAQLINPDVKVGEQVQILLPFKDFPRLGTRSAINLLYKKLEELRRIREFSEFDGRAGEIVTCIVKQTYSDGQIIATLGKGIGVIYRNDLLPSEMNKYKPGDRIQAYIKEVTQEHKYQILLSRTHSQFLAKLLTLQVPELVSGEIEIKKIVREAGRRSKVAVASHSNNIDPVRACVGQSGKRIEPVIEELKGEKIDIIPWSDNLVQFSVSALKPAEVQQVISRANNLILVVPDEQKKKAIGEHGSNVKLASAITQTNISVLTQSEAAERSIELQTFFEITLDVDNDIAALLVSKGFETMYDINHTETAELSQSTGMDEEVINELKERAETFTETTKNFFQEKTDLDKKIKEIPGLRTPYIQKLYESGVKTLDNLAVQPQENIEKMLAEYKVTPLSIQRFITYAQKKTGRLKRIQSNVNYRRPSTEDANYRKPSFRPENR